MGSVVANFVLLHWRKGWWVVMIPLALVLMGAIVELVKLIGEKQERKAMIEQGVDPDTVAKKAPTLR